MRLLSGHLGVECRCRKAPIREARGAPTHFGAPVERDRAAARASIESVRHGMPICEVSARTAEGMAERLLWIESAASVVRRLAAPRGLH
jgi:hypothetical protein